MVLNTRFFVSKCLVALVLGALVLGATEAHAALYPFRVIQDDDWDPTNAQIGQEQLTVEVTEGAAPGTILFTFMNAEGGAPCSISEVYFEDGALLGISGLKLSIPDVWFNAGYAAPGNLPGGGSLNPPFETTKFFLADSDVQAAQVSGTGVDPGESLGVQFTLLNGMEYADVIAAIDQGLLAPNPTAASYHDSLGPPSLRIGIHVRSFANGGSESFVNGVPVPGAVLLGGLGLAVASYRLRRKRA